MARKRINLTSKHKSPSGGLNEAGRRFARSQGSNLKRPIKSGDSPRRASFLARMGASRGPYNKKGKKTRKILALRKWEASSSADERKKEKKISERNKKKKEKKA